MVSSHPWRLQALDSVCIMCWAVQANEQLQVVRESHAATSIEVADAHRCVRCLHQRSGSSCTCCFRTSQKLLRLRGSLARPPSSESFRLLSCAYSFPFLFMNCCDPCRLVKALEATVKELQQQVDGAREAHALVVAELDVRASPDPCFWFWRTFVATLKQQKSARSCTPCQPDRLSCAHLQHVSHCRQSSLLCQADVRNIPATLLV